MGPLKLKKLLGQPCMIEDFPFNAVGACEMIIFHYNFCGICLYNANEFESVVNSFTRSENVMNVTSKLLPHLSID